MKRALKRSYPAYDDESGKQTLGIRGHVDWLRVFRFRPDRLLKSVR